MNHKYDFGPEVPGNTVYIRRVTIDSLPDDKGVAVKWAKRF